MKKRKKGENAKIARMVLSGAVSPHVVRLLPDSCSTGIGPPIATLLSFMRVLGVDLGSKRIGLAVSDPEANIAFPAGTLKSGGRKADVEAVCDLISEREIGAVVVGLPKHMDGRRGPEASAAEKFASALQKASGIPVETLDERWTSVEAERSLSEQGKSAKRSRDHVDEVAAALILRTYLELMRNSPRSPDHE